MNATPKSYDVFDLKLYELREKRTEDGREYLMEFRSTIDGHPLVMSHATADFPCVANIAKKLVDLQELRSEEKLRMIVVRDFIGDADSAKGYTVVYSDGFLTGGKRVCSTMVQAAIRKAVDETALHLA